MSPSRSRKKRKQRRQGKPDRLESLKRKLQSGPWRDVKIEVAPGGEPKMSGVLLDFVEPYRKYADSEEALRKLLTLAVMAWDASLLPEEDQQAMIDRVLAAGGVSEEVRPSLKEVVNTLLARKKAYFAEYTRIIIDFEVQDTSRGIHVSVASAPREAPVGGV
jgi:hypothetical protein